MSHRYCFLTTKRAHLFGLAKFLIGGIDPLFFEDQDNPVIVTVRGSQSSGKKIFYDAAKKFLLGGDDNCQTRLDPDEHNEGLYNGRRISVDFVDAAYLGGYNSIETLSTRDPRIVAEMFLGKGRGSGLVVVQNEHVTAEKESWIDLLVETSWGGVVDVDPGTGLLRDKFLKSQLACGVAPYGKILPIEAKLLTEEDKGNLWARYVAVTINNEALLASPMFQRRLELLSPLGEGLPVWSENLPRRKNLKPPLK